MNEIERIIDRLNYCYYYFYEILSHIYNFLANLSSSIDLTRQVPIENCIFEKGKLSNHFYELGELIFYTVNFIN